MKVITEQLLREELRNTQPETYYIPEGKILSPAAREYLQQRQIKISKGPAPEIRATEVPPMPTVSMAQPAAQTAPNAKYIDYETGAFFTEKPENMTHLYGNVLVPKSDPHIFFRGKLDSLQSLVVLSQAQIKADGGSQKLLDDLAGILSNLRELMRCDVLNEPFTCDRIIGLTHAELRERSHDPMKFFHIKQMVLPDYTMGISYALLNSIRTAVRETEVAAAIAFQEGKKTTRSDVIEELNRMSSAMHIMMCMYLAGEYK